MVGESVHGHAALVTGERFEFHLPVRHGQHGLGVFGPLGELEPRCREHIAKAGIEPLARIREAVEVEVREGPAVDLIGLQHRIGRALDAALDAKRTQQVAHEGGLARAERANQGDEAVAAQRG